MVANDTLAAGSRAENRPARRPFCGVLASAAGSDRSTPCRGPAPTVGLRARRSGTSTRT